MNQISVDSHVLARLIDNYLRLEIQTQHHIVAAPTQPTQHVLNSTLLQGKLDSLRIEFEKCQTSDDYAVCFVKLERLWDDAMAANS